MLCIYAPRQHIEEMILRINWLRVLCGATGALIPMLWAVMTAYASDCPLGGGADCDTAASTAQNPIIPILAAGTGVVAAGFAGRFLAGFAPPILGAPVVPTSQVSPANREDDWKWIKEAEKEDEIQKLIEKGYSPQEAQAELDRKKMKAVAPRIAPAITDASNILRLGAGAAAVGTWWTGAGGLVAGGLSVAAGATGWLGGKFTRIANDPPRQDFQIASKFEPVNFTLKPPANDLEATWQDFASRNILLGSAIDMLVTSIERHDGLRALRLNSRMPLNPEHAGHMLAQVDAITHNAAACARLTEDLLAVQPKVNLAWGQLKVTFQFASLSRAPLTYEQLSSKLAETWEGDRRDIQTYFGLSETEIANVSSRRHQAIQQLSLQKGPVSVPDTLLDEGWKERTRANSLRFHEVSRAYASLKISLQDQLGMDGFATPPAPPVIPAERRCPRCGRAVPGSKNFCTACGTRL
jgi:hypothetical protein